VVPPHATNTQINKLQELLQKHYQGLIQQAILTIRAAREIKTPLATTDDNNDNAATPTFFHSGETDMDLAEVLDLAVNMLQDLDQHRKDAIRTAIQLEAWNQQQQQQQRQTHNDSDDMETNTSPLQGRRSLLTEFDRTQVTLVDAKINDDNDRLFSQPESRPLTRATFQRLQQQHSSYSRRPTAFDIPGLERLRQTFASIDTSVDTIVQKTSHHMPTHNNNNILKAHNHAQACRNVLREAGAHIHESLLPGTTDIDHNFTSMEDSLNVQSFVPPCTPTQELSLRKNRNLFTSAEDNLVLRGVNLYGEKQWLLISDRYLPDRSVNIISQRYSKLCVMLYKARGVYMDDQGNLAQPPKLESVDDIDEDMVKKAGLVTVDPPAILNVHRWSLEEDVALLKAVPIMGHMWAELGARLIPHRDRGHLRKRYQVLERRVKTTIMRDKKGVTKKKGSTKAKGTTTTPTTQKSPTKTTTAKQAAKKPPSGATIAPNAAAATKSAIAMSPSKSPATSTAKATRRTPSKQNRTAAATDASSSTKPKSTEKKPAMSLEHAAATLAFAKSKEGFKASQLAGSTSDGLANLPSSTGTPHQQQPPYYNGYPPQAGTAWPFRHSHYQPGAYPYPYPPGAYPYPVYPGATPASHASLATGSNTSAKTTETNAQRTSQAVASAAESGEKAKAKKKAPNTTLDVASLKKAASKETAISSNKGTVKVTARKSTTDKEKADALPRASPKEKAKTLSKQSGAAAKGKKSGAAAKGKKVGCAQAPPNVKEKTQACKLKPRARRKFSSSKAAKPIDVSIAGNDKTLYHQEDATRLAYEKLLDAKGDHEWSQMSGVNHLMANEEETEAANAIVSHLAKSPGQGASTLSQFTGALDALSNLSGLSILNEGTKQHPNTTSEETKDNVPGMGLMARVLANSTSKSYNPKSTDASNRTKAKTQGNSADLRHLSGTMHVSTPGRKPTGSGGNVFSPGFQSPTAMLRAGAGLNTNMSFPYSPTNSNLMGVFDEDRSNQTGGAFTRGFSLPGDSQLQKDLQCKGKGNSRDDNNSSNNLRHQYSDICAVGGGVNSNSLMIGTDDYEAVSALEALSNSPFQRASQQSAKASGDDDDANKKPASSAVGAGKSARQSLFSKVIGGTKKNKNDVNDDDDQPEVPPKKKLKF
jgi:hypothetical protein